jgi:hypothetical protein
MFLHTLAQRTSLYADDGLDADFAQVLTREERIAGPEGMANAGARVLVVHHTRKYSCENPEGRMGYQVWTRAENAANALMR